MPSASHQYVPSPAPANVTTCVNSWRSTYCVPETPTLLALTTTSLLIRLTLMVKAAAQDGCFPPYHLVHSSGPATYTTYRLGGSVHFAYLSAVAAAFSA